MRAIYTARSLVACAVLVVAALSSCREKSATSGPHDVAIRDLAEYRVQHPTRLQRRGGPPEEWRSDTPLVLPTGVSEVTYDSGGLPLRAWLSDPPVGDGASLRPAVVFCHGGFWFDNSDWDVLAPFLDAGFVVMAPRVRAENGNPGDFEYYFGEVDDVLAAGRFLAKQKGVDPTRVFVCGHSAGGALATLAVMMDNPFAVAAPIGASLDMRRAASSRSERHKALVVFDSSDSHEVESRSAVLFTSSLRRPVALFCGDKDFGVVDEQREFVSLALRNGKNATLTMVAGNHGASLPNALPKIVKLFQEYRVP